MTYPLQNGRHVIEGHRFGHMGHQQAALQCGWQSLYVIVAHPGDAGQQLRERPWPVQDRPCRATCASITLNSLTFVDRKVSDECTTPTTQVAVVFFLKHGARIGLN